MSDVKVAVQNVSSVWDKMEEAMKAIDPLARVDRAYSKDVSENGILRVCVEYDLFGGFEENENAREVFSRMKIFFDGQHGSIGSGMYSPAHDAVAGWTKVRLADWQ